MKHPTAIQPWQKTVAELLSVGTPIEKAAAIVGKSEATIKVLLKGGLFQFEVDEARERLVGERLREYTKLVSEQLKPNLETAIAIRDNALKDSDRLRAIELINDALVPKARPREATTEARVKLTFSGEQAHAIKSVIAEAADAPAVDAAHLPSPDGD